MVLDEAAGKMLDGQAGSDVSRYFYCPKASSAERNANPSVVTSTVPANPTGLPA